MKWTLVLLLGSLCASVPSRAGVDSTWEPEGRPLYDLVDPALQARLESRIAADPHWARLAARERLSVGVVDLNGTVPRFARVNGNTMMYAASLPKIAILLAAYVALEEGSLPNTPEVHSDMKPPKPGTRKRSSAASFRSLSSARGLCLGS